MDELPYEIWIQIIDLLENPFNMLVSNKYTLSMTKYLKNINSFFMIFVEQGNLSWVKILHSQGYDIRFQNNEALKIACKYGYLEIVKYLYDHGCDIFIDNNFCLKIASERGHLEIVKYLYQNGYKFSNDSKPILDIAAANGHFEIIKYVRLLNPNNINKNGCIRMCWKIDNYDISIISYYYTDNKFKDNIYRATEYGNIEIIKKTWNKFCGNITVSNNLFKIAVVYGHLNIIKYMFKKGHRFPRQSNELIQIACGKGYLDIVKYLHKKGFSIVDSLLNIAGRFGHHDVVEYLYKRLKNVNLQKVITITIENDYLEIVKFFVTKENNPDEIRTYLILAHKHGHNRIIRYFDSLLIMTQQKLQSNLEN
ncbi:putative ankyrin repeat protein [Acanthamoeba castellanii mimivirus]|uniref:Putative ankyrin repeat protein R903 n=6 Tax=Megamimivirinae TaxID=3044648 RepID=YR903_MIMIV|nr:putative ankyrin repeat protein [Acanthamoeba polyphaga mimivirus]Q5UQZ5.1 RecName: Full=Putative ankyrin repeat protein R903 [Acanthamoeba polyphaga mimivirus]AEQ61122.1 ankyrin repeat-containing protein [Acanthamoeba castellanii mamavirus]AHA44918.1 putative ankyrin repeat protein [Hirudovirus strain Sangsue]AHJ40454.2 ankyrin repeat protein [Samba virus]ALR84539.1 ankyrin repeat-containing protein [Niemeyer virus]AMZ03339.1 putative ankyrin repeat protein [Mimivirus Bombay]AUV59041.1 a